MLKSKGNNSTMRQKHNNRFHLDHRHIHGHLADMVEEKAGNIFNLSLYRPMQWYKLKEHRRTIFK